MFFMPGSAIYQLGVASLPLPTNWLFPAGPPGTPGTAKKVPFINFFGDGLSFDGLAKLGQAVGAAGNPAALTEDRQIPMAGSYLELTDAVGGSYLDFPAVLLKSVVADPVDGTDASLNNRNSIIAPPASGFAGGYICHALVEPVTGFYGYIGIQAWDYVWGQGSTVVPGNAAGQKFPNYIAAYSNNQIYDNIGSTLNTLLGHFSALNVQNGTVTNAYDNYASELNSTDSTSNFGTVVNHYALFAEPFTKATNNWLFYCAGVQPSYTAGKVGLGITAATARLHCAAGTAAANTGAIKLTTGVLATVPEDGLLEYAGGHLYFTIGAIRTQII